MGCAPSVKKVSPNPTERSSINTVTVNGIKSHKNGINGMSNGTNETNETNETNGMDGTNEMNETNFATNYSKFKTEPSSLLRQSSNPFDNESEGEDDDDLDDSYVNGELDKYFDDGNDENDTKEISDYYDDHQNHMESNGKDINTEGGSQPTAPQQEAATKIQAYYRGHNSRRSNNQQEQDEQEEVKPIDITNSQSQDNQGQKIIENDKMDQNENKSQSTDKDPVNKAATTIQAGYKGYKVRKEIKKDGKSSDEGSPVKQSTGQQDIDAEIADIDLNDPEVEKAATKIQATFRGFKSRREPNTESQSNK